jgi:hypothetical protein
MAEREAREAEPTSADEARDMDARGRRAFAREREDPLLDDPESIERDSRGAEQCA